jgi:hypothetical protein
MSSAPCLADSDCIHLELDGDSNLVATPIISPDDGNLIVCQPNGLYAAAGVVPESVTLPESPVDGQEFVYEFDAYSQWLFRYDTDESSSYRWKFVGGSPAYAQNGVQITEHSPDGNWHNGSPLLSLVLPFAGFYMVRYGAILNPAEDGKSVKVGVEVNGTDPTRYAVNANVRAASAERENHLPNNPATPIALPGTTVVLQYNSESHDGPDDFTIDDRWLAVTPMKVG